MKVMVLSLWLFVLSWNSPVQAELLPYSGLNETLPLALQDLSGDQRTLAAERGRLVLVNFWASWCTPCLLEMPDMQRLQDAMKDRPFTILAVNVKEPRAKAWRFLNLLKVNFTVLLDGDGAAAEAWDVQFYPTSFLVDAEGRIRYQAFGALDWDGEDVRQTIEQLMPDPEPVSHETRASLKTP